jgi:hypothetical protein
MKPLMADQGLPGSGSLHPNPYLFRGEGAKSPAKPPTAADPNTTMTSGVVRYKQIAFSGLWFMAIPIFSVYLYKRRSG